MLHRRRAGVRPQKYHSAATTRIRIGFGAPAAHRAPKSALCERTPPVDWRTAPHMQRSSSATVRGMCAVVDESGGTCSLQRAVCARDTPKMSAGRWRRKAGRTVCASYTVTHNHSITGSCTVCRAGEGIDEPAHLEASPAQASIPEEPAKYSSWTVMTMIESFASPIVSDSMLSSRCALRRRLHHIAALQRMSITAYDTPWTMSWSESAGRSARATDLR